MPQTAPTSLPARPMVPGSIPPRAWLAVLALACGASACRSDVQFYEKAALSDPVMDMAERPLETHWHAKLFFSLEGSIGGFGTSGGGGCGCY